MVALSCPGELIEELRELSVLLLERVNFRDNLFVRAHVQVLLGEEDDLLLAFVEFPLQLHVLVHHLLDEGPDLFEVGGLGAVLEDLRWRALDSQVADGAYELLVVFVVLENLLERSTDGLRGGGGG